MLEPHLIKPPASGERAQHWIDRLQAQGYRITASRRAVVSTLAATQQALTPNDLHKLGQALHARLGLVTVYRTLEKLEELELVQRLHLPDGCHAYLPAFEGHKHLLVCEACGRVEVFEGDDLGDFSQQLERESGFEIHDHWLQFFGLCVECH